MWQVHLGVWASFHVDFRVLADRLLTLLVPEYVPGEVRKDGPHQQEEDTED
jgi:hypothetical protein